MTRILAIDPGKSTGWAFSSVKDRIEASGVWNLGDPAESRPGRLAEHIRIAVAKHQPTVIAYEMAAMGGKFQRASARLSEMCGAIQGVAHELGCTLYAWNIVSWKFRAVGKGNADKPAIIRALRTFFRIEVADSNEADACAILLASQMGPPPEPQKKARRRVEKVLAKRQAKLFR